MRTQTIAVSRAPIGDFRVALDDSGDAAVAWQGDSAQGFEQLFVRSRPRGGAFGPAVALSDPSADASWIALAISTDGTEMAAWVEHYRPSGTRQQLWASVRPRDGDWSAPELVSGEGYVDEPAVAFAPDGTAFVAWVDIGDVSQVELRERHRDGAWSAPRRLSSGPRDAGGPQISFDAAGDATVVWERGGPLVHAVPARAGRSRLGQAAIIATVVRADGTQAAARALSDPHHDSGDAFIAQNGRGDAAVFWVLNVGDHFRIDYALRARRGGFGRRHALTHLRDDATEPLAAIDARGNLVAVWRQSTRSPASGCNCFRAFLSRRPHGGRFGAPRAASPRNVDGFSLAGNGRGRAMLLWNSQGRRAQRIQARGLSTSGRLRAIQTLSLSPADTDIAAAMNLSGETIVAWVRSVRHRDRLELTVR